MNDESLSLFRDDPLAYLKSKVNNGLRKGHFRLGAGLYNYMLYEDSSRSKISQKTGIDAFECNEYEKLDAIETFLGVPIRKDPSIGPFDIEFDCRSFDLKENKIEYLDDSCDSRAYKNFQEITKDPALLEQMMGSLKLFRKLVREDIAQTEIKLSNGGTWITCNRTDKGKVIPNNKLDTNKDKKEDIIENKINNEHEIEDGNRAILHDSSNENTKEEKEFNVDEYVRIEAIKICDVCFVNIDYNKIQDEVNLLLKF